MATNEYDDPLPPEEPSVSANKGYSLNWANLETVQAAIRNNTLTVTLEDRGYTLQHDMPRYDNHRGNRMLQDMVDRIISRQVPVPVDIRPGEVISTTRPRVDIRPVSQRGRAAASDTGIYLYVGAQVMTCRGMPGVIVYRTIDGLYLMVHTRSSSRLPDLCWYTISGRAVYDIGNEHDIVSILPDNQSQLVTQQEELQP